MREEATISKNKVQLNKREDNSIISAQEISKTWKNGFIDKVESETEKGCSSSVFIDPPVPPRIVAETGHDSQLMCPVGVAANL